VSVSIAGIGLALLPAVLPILSIPDLIAYPKQLQFNAPRMENREIAPSMRTSPT
jgi:hypothetical protein